MGINVPDLDDREFEAVFEEARRQIPVHSDDWRDHNRHDTGIAILEMLSWVSETLTYQIDQVTEHHREKHLQLLGVGPNPPQPATTRVAVSPPDSTDGAVIPAGEPLAVDDRSGVTKTFETSSRTVLTAARIAKVMTYSGDDAVNRTTEARTDDTQFHAFGADPTDGDALYIGFDGDPFANAETLTLTIEFYDDDLPAPATHGSIDGTFEPSVDLSWEYCTSYNHWETDGAWASLPVRADGTNAFYRDGRVTLEPVPGWELATENSTTASLFGQPSGLVWIRCRVDQPGYEISPRIDTIRLNGVPVSHRHRIEDEQLTHPDGRTETTIQADQAFVFEHSPVLAATISIDGERWREVADLDRSGPTDTHFELDHGAGSITFGDGIHGAKPPVGRRVRAVEYVTGGGADGNISSEATWEFQRADRELADGITLGELPLTPTGSASGGTDTESIADARDRFKRDFKRTYRAATLEDYGTVATRTPGLRFGRAHAVQTGDHTIQVVVVPYSRRAKPRPSAGFLSAVSDHLERTRLLTDSVTVLEPTYVDIGARLSVTALPGYTEAALTDRVRERLATSLHPLDGTPWPFGQPLYVADVRTTVEEIPGVRSVESLTLAADGDAEIDDHGNVLIDDLALLSLSTDAVTVTVDREVEP